MQMLVEHTWPGNVRELENVIERACVFSDAEIVEPRAIQFDRMTLQQSKHPHTPHFSLSGQSLAEIERQAIVETLESCSGNKAKAARVLGVSERTIYNKMEKYAIGEAATEFA